MFTGIVEELGSVVALEHPGADASDAVLTVTGPLVTSDARPGDSIAVDGVCLTVTSVADGTFVAEVMPETLRRTSLGRLAPGDAVNLERALPASGRLGGHVVQGHVDGVATLVRRTPGPRWDDLAFAAPAALTRYVAEKGSVALSGVSLTVTWVTDDGFGVSLIPTTLAATTLGRLVPTDPVNVEVDVLAKYVERLLAGRAVDAGTTPAEALPLVGDGAAGGAR
ncbi:riboflavin synthase [Promicromonospora citrea]|uniref:Riboflavin synthase n=1 Tax=Promicromonospora citrea TaxID=43677 RepID=A0A8H9GHZ2_9MICO|nr:riboflavin synthase [Promicromonospora citrea]NNH55205.1 riboflavin synthase [Promicromonospora citrea]GGM28650.1 riboflavin synthase subunit alpha [Promicromonospora citrea]